MSDLRKPHWLDIRDTLQGKRQVVHDRLMIHGPCTARELADAMNWDKCSCRPRLCELHHAGLAEPTGERRNGEHVMRGVPLSVAEARAREVEMRAMTSQQLPLFA